jgi:hypothetical protein
MTTGTADPFTQPSSAKHPKVNDLFGRLLLLTPSVIEKVPGYQNKGVVDRVTADVVVLDGGEFEGSPTPALITDMYFSQAALVGTLRKALRTGQPVLGRLYRNPTKDNSSKYPTREALEAAFTAWRPGQEAIQYVWTLEGFTEDEAAVARQYLATSQTRVAAPAPAQDEKPPF